MSQNKPLVLLIDDSTYVLDVVTLELPAFGYEVIGAATLDEAREQFKQHDVDAVLLDLFLPGFVGHMLLKEFKIGRPHVPVIVISGTENPEDRAVVMAHGADEFIMEPLTVKLLADELDKALA